jgi:hypothetical protein
MCGRLFGEGGLGELLTALRGSLDVARRTGVAGRPCPRAGIIAQALHWVPCSSLVQGRRTAVLKRLVLQGDVGCSGVEF